MYQFMNLTYFLGLRRNINTCTDVPVYDPDLLSWSEEKLSIHAVMYQFMILTFLLGLRRNINTCTDVPVYDLDLLSWSEEKYQYMH